jgi:hypothetical protein
MWKGNKKITCRQVTWKFVRYMPMHKVMMNDKLAVEVIPEPSYLSSDGLT